MNELVNKVVNGLVNGKGYGSVNELVNQSDTLITGVMTVVTPDNKRVPVEVNIHLDIRLIRLKVLADVDPDLSRRICSNLRRGISAVLLESSPPESRV